MYIFVVVILIGSQEKRVKDLFSSEDSLFKKIFPSVYYNLIKTVNITFLSLNFFSFISSEIIFFLSY